jgi:acetylornithine deacetylase/succinyl-diaminopimelate desuccinylase-like protein
MLDTDRYFDDHQAAYLDELLDFLTIPSISALPEHAGDVRRAAQWVAERLTRAGLEHVQLLETGAHPVAYADWLHAPGRPTALIYGHFDTQPADPLELWERPPFEPHVVGDRIYARGATDNKGNMLVPILAAEALLATRGALPINVKFLFEGQEEIGSPQLPAFIQGHRELLACDLALNADTGQYSESEPSITVGLKGICGVQLDMRGPSRDVHSGVYGGAIQNPLHALARLLDSMRSPEGKIMVQGFYADVRPLSDEDRAAIAAVPHDEEALKADLGVDTLYGEPGYTTRERAGARPTLEVNGLWGGFTGEGTKTVIPSEAHAKITCRLVPDQDPARIIALIRAHVAQHTPPGVKVTVASPDNGARAYLAPADHPGVRAAAEVLTALYGREPYLERSGGSVPVTTFFQEYLGVYTISFGFGLPDERIHSPNEFYRKSSFRRGQTAYAMLLDRLAQESL